VRNCVSYKIHNQVKKIYSFSLRDDYRDVGGRVTQEQLPRRPEPAPAEAGDEGI
jgi:hypothetical protein